jgi:hypothetical protein
MKTYRGAPSGTFLSAEQALQRPVDVVVPVTYSSNLFADGPRLSSLSRAAIDAAQLVCEELPDARMAIAGERTFDGFATTSELMCDRVVERGFSADRVTVLGNDRPDYNLIHTARQMRAVSDHMDETGDEHALAVAMDYHGPRVHIHADAFGLSTLQVVSVQSVLWRQGVAGEYPELAHLRPFRQREAPIRMVSRFDPTGRVLDWGAARQGPRLHDVVESDGKLEPVLSTARNRLAELRRNGVEVSARVTSL